ncbi:MAG: DegT/DnrJ/EryC1/StrS family aminotransferase [Chloroflexota bacterium]|nr:DegT/DnrJ/EryC1/StrS family aminotransferase [Chloroflexota bacterium]
MTNTVTADAARLAIDGGTPVRATRPPSDRGAAYIGAAEKAAVLDVLESQALFRYGHERLRHRTEQFEAKLRALTGAQYAVGVSSGTAALRVGLAALDVGPGDEVIVPAVTFIASPNAVIAQGAVPVFAEVDASFTLDPDALAARIGPRTKAIMPVHLMGTACRMDEVMAIAQRHGLRVLEDCAQASGASYRGRAVGRWGDAGALSFQLSKNITAGEGGALVTDDPELFNRANKFQDQGGQFTLGIGGARERVGEPISGENLRMGEIAGAILGVQVDRLPAITAAVRHLRDQIVAGLREALPELPLRPVPDTAGEVPTAVGFYFDTADRATRVAKAISAEGVPARKVYSGAPVYANPSILHQRTVSSTGRPFTDPLYLARGPKIEYAMGMCPRSEDYLSRCVVVGVSPLMTEADAEDVVTAVEKVVRNTPH